jgi:hypothetical protein
MTQAMEAEQTTTGGGETARPTGRRGRGVRYPEQVVTVIDKATRRRVDAQVEETDLTMSQIMRRALIEYLDKREVVDPHPELGNE